MRRSICVTRAAVHIVAFLALALICGCGKKESDVGPMGQKGQEGAPAVNAKVIKLSHITSNTSHWHKGGERFAELVAERTKGRYAVKLYPGAQIASRNQRTELQMLQSGGIDMSFESPIILALFLDPRFDAFSIPWLFPDLKTARAGCTGELGDLACQWLTENELVGIGVGVNGFRQLTNSKLAVRTPGDMKGLTFRVAGTNLFLETFRLLGTNARTQDFGEVFTLLQEGAIDGQENPLAIIYTSKLYEVQKHLTLWNYAFDPIILCVNNTFWSSIPEADQKTFKECAQEAMEYQWDYSEELENNILAELKEHGMTITKLSAAELAAFREQARPIDKYLEKNLGADLVRKWRDAVEKLAAAASDPEEGAADK